MIRPSEASFSATSSTLRPSGMVKRTVFTVPFTRTSMISVIVMAGDKVYSPALYFPSIPCILDCNLKESTLSMMPCSTKIFPIPVVLVPVGMVTVMVSVLVGSNALSASPMITEKPPTPMAMIAIKAITMIRRPFPFFLRLFLVLILYFYSSNFSNPQLVPRFKKKEPR